ncbi:MAG: hypothetical protein RR918_00805, partial [Anaerovoracaceae bacterium]
NRRNAVGIVMRKHLLCQQFAVAKNAVSLECSCHPDHCLGAVGFSTAKKRLMPFLTRLLLKPA